ncbi:hypothetical protein PR002_g15900 [Phytophthora rubi]|uniref:Secreted protein n=1 Tax=Phytophthora rubi TaxID=129364 RepID=A0A6A3KN26_9STRA|nr:hypothetical protein PR002_g15900 [Phytophthora rubi]
MASRPRWWRFALAFKMLRPAWRGSMMSTGTWTACETVCGICLGSLTTRLAACGPDVRKARRTTRWRVRALGDTLTGYAPCRTVWVSWRPKRHAA